MLREEVCAHAVRNNSCWQGHNAVQDDYILQVLKALKNSSAVAAVAEALPADDT